MSNRLKLLVLIVAKCIVNSNKSLISFKACDSINSSKVYCKLVSSVLEITSTPY